jgi:hypothetical protein
LNATTACALTGASAATLPAFMATGESAVRLREDVRLDFLSAGYSCSFVATIFVTLRLACLLGVDFVHNLNYNKNKILKNNSENQK